MTGYNSNRALDLANSLAERERDAGIEAASKALQGNGITHCIDCQKPIPQRRREAIPSATRCFECQQIAEKEEAIT